MQCIIEQTLASKAAAAAASSAELPAAKAASECLRIGCTKIETEQNHKFLHDSISLNAMMDRKKDNTNPNRKIDHA